MYVCVCQSFTLLGLPSSQYVVLLPCVLCIRFQRKLNCSSCKALTSRYMISCQCPSTYVCGRTSFMLHAALENTTSRYGSPSPVGNAFCVMLSHSPVVKLICACLVFISPFLWSLSHVVEGVIAPILDVTVSINNQPARSPPPWPLSQRFPVYSSPPPRRSCRFFLRSPSIGVVLSAAGLPFLFLFGTVRCAIFAAATLPFILLSGPAGLALPPARRCR